MALKEQMLDCKNVERYSPELVAKQWEIDGIKGVIHEYIYDFIWTFKHSQKRINKKFKEAYKFLKHGKRRRKLGNYEESRGLIPNRVSIEQRTVIAKKKAYFDVIEVDLIMGKTHKFGLLVTLDRATLLTKIDKLNGKNSDVIIKKIIDRLKNCKFK